MSSTPSNGPRWWPAVVGSSSHLARNVGANAASAVWNGLLIVAVTPWYVSLLGFEGYGLIGFWVVMQVVLSLCDLGMGATLVRDYAAANGAPDGPGRRRHLLRTLEVVYWPLAALLTMLLAASAGWIAESWLNLRVLPADQVARSIVWMALALGLQFPGSLYANGLLGLQRQGRLALIQIGANTLRYGGGLAVLLWRADPVPYFLAQALVSAVQTAATRAMLSRSLTRTDAAATRPAFRPELLRHAWRFSAGMALTAAAGVLLANVDRLFLSAMMPAAELGKYTMAWSVTGLVQLGVQPFYRAYFPRFAELQGTEDREKLRQVYFQGCRAVAWMIIPAALAAWAFAPEIFIVWTGNADRTMVTVLRWLLVGVACAGLMWLPAGFQQAHGWTSLHAAMVVGALITGVASLGWTIGRWGTAGAAAAWVLHGVSDLTLGLWLMHRRLLPGEFGEWWRTVVVPPVLCGAPIVAASWFMMPLSLGRWSMAAWLAGTGVAAVAPLLLSRRTVRTEPAPEVRL